MGAPVATYADDNYNAYIATCYGDRVRGLTMGVGDKFLLGVGGDPINVLPDATVVWSTSDSAVVSVDSSGRLTALGVGYVEVSLRIVAHVGTFIDVIPVKVWAAGSRGLRTVGGESLHIEPKGYADTNLYNDMPSFAVCPGDVVYLQAYGGGVLADSDVTWGSSKEDVATVENGKVTAKGVGTTTVTATALLPIGENKADVECTASLVVSVVPTPKDPDPVGDPDPVNSGDTVRMLEQAVTVAGSTQRVRVYDPNGVLPDGAQFKVEVVSGHAGVDDTHEAEHVLSYNLRLLDAAGNPIQMPLSKPVELWFEVVPGLDVGDLQVVLVNTLGPDREFTERIETRDGGTWVVVTTDHFSPYALIDTFSEEEKAARNPKTGDVLTTSAVTSLAAVLVMALGVMLRLVKNKKEFDV